MIIAGIILGVILVCVGFACMFTPVVTALCTGYFILIMFLVYGIMGIVRFFRKESGALELILSILYIIVGLSSLFMPGQTLVFDRILLYLLAVMFTLQGAVSVYLSVKRKEEHKDWVLGVFVGFLDIVLGIYSIFHPMLEAALTGILIGLYFIESGFNMIVAALFAEKVKETAETVADTLYGKRM